MVDDDKKLRELKFDTEVSAWYHDYRRSHLGFLSNCVRLVSLVGAIAAIVAVSISIKNVFWLVSIASVLIATVNLLELVFNVDEKARLHTSLYGRFKVLQAKIARGEKDWRENIAEWEADAQTIRVDEPPAYWALWNICFNQMIDKYHLPQNRKHHISTMQRALKNLRRFRSGDFAPQIGVNEPKSA